MQLSSYVFGAERDHEGHAGGARTGASPPAVPVRGQVISNGQVLLAALRRKPDPAGGTRATVSWQIVSAQSLGLSGCRRRSSYPLTKAVVTGSSTKVQTIIKKVTEVLVR